jgi:hypothetical protein
MTPAKGGSAGRGDVDTSLLSLDAAADDANANVGMCALARRIANLHGAISYDFGGDP